MSDADKAALEAAGGKVVDYAPRQDIIVQGDNPHDAHLLLDGWAGRYKLMPDGGRKIMAFVIPGDLCDVHVALLDQMDHSIGALSACKVLFLPRQKLNEMMDASPELSRALWWSTLVDESVLREWLVNLGGRPASQRIGHLICEMLLRCRAVGLANENNFEMPLSQEELADTMGMTPVHMNRCLQELRGGGLITSQGRRIFIDDLDALMAFSGFDPIYLHQIRNGSVTSRVSPR